MVTEFQLRAPFRVSHLWQRNRGFRKCRILNQALGQARGDLCIFLDGDCIPHRHFFRDHIESYAPGTFGAGRRFEVGPELAKTLTVSKIRHGWLDYPKWGLIRSVLKKDSTHLQRTMRVLNPFLRSVLRLNRVIDMKGCNYSVSRSDLLKINGFDEFFEGYGREDTDVEERLKNLGLEIRSLKGMALQFHVWHARREFTPKNDTLLDLTKGRELVRCKAGVFQEFLIEKATLGDLIELCRVYAESWKAHYVGLLPQDFLDSLNEVSAQSFFSDYLTKASENPSQFLVLKASDSQKEVVGFLVGGVDRFAQLGGGPDVGEIISFYTSPEMQRRHLGTQLFNVAKTWYLENHFSRLRTWVLHTNPSRMFYEKLGGKLTAHTKTQVVGGQTCFDLCYEWKPLKF